MAVAGIIAEYNPFHRGHAWQLGELRRRLGEGTAVVAAMSGSFVQRGDFGIFSKHARAEAAVRGGVDLVLELPGPWSAAAAERFARGGVALLGATGVVTHLVFGSEAGRLEPLEETAAALESEEYRERLRRHLGTGVTFAAARERAAADVAGECTACLRSPNNALAVEYLRAVASLGASMEPVALPRVGADHDSGVLCEFSSASAIRELLLSGGAWEALVPETTAAVIRREMADGRGPVTIGSCERAVLARLRMLEEADFARWDGGGEGLYHRFYDAVQSSVSLEELLSAAKTKRYPLARLRRMLLHSYLDMTQAAWGETPAYLRVLAANGRGRALLGEMRKAASLPVITKPAAARRLEEPAREQFRREAVRTDLYVLAYPDLGQAPTGSEYTRGPVLL